jgi:transposase
MASIEAAEGAVTIGVDPHPGSHTAAALDPLGGLQGTRCVVNGEDAGQELLEWAQRFPRRRWAIEGAGNRFVQSVVVELVVAGEEVVSIPPSMTSQYRRRRGRKKDDVIDAANAAKALQANPELPRYVPVEHEAHLKAVSRAYHRVSTELTRLRMMKSSAEDAVVVAALERAIAGVKDSAHALRSELEAITQELAPELLERQGIGPIIAGAILAEVGAITRFADRDHLAAYAGAAPMVWSSGAHSVNRVNPGGNRQLNWAVHMIVRTRLRLDERTKAFRDRKLAEGKTDRAIMRALKTYVLREIYTVMRKANENAQSLLEVASAA